MVFTIHVVRLMLQKNPFKGFFVAMSLKGSNKVLFVCQGTICDNFSNLLSILLIKSWLLYHLQFEVVSHVSELNDLLK